MSTHYSSSNSAGSNEDMQSVSVSTSPSEIAAIEEDGVISVGLQRRVLEAAVACGVSPNRCIITNMARQTVIYCHVVPRTTPDYELSRLEYSWGMRYRSLNLDSSQNLFPLDYELFRSFRSGLWLLVPDDPYVLEAYENHHIRGEEGNHFFDLQPAGPYKYRFIASLSMMGRMIVRRHSPEGHMAGKAGTNFQGLHEHYFPFHDLPAITSHIHPRFVIYHAGRAFMKKKHEYTHLPLGLKSTLETVQRIFQIWSLRIPSTDKAVSFFLRGVPWRPLDSQGDDQASDTSDVTLPERYDQTSPSTYLTSDSVLALDAFSPPEPSRRRKVLNWRAGLLDAPVNQHGGFDHVPHGVSDH